VAKAERRRKEGRDIKGTREEGSKKKKKP